MTKDGAVILYAAQRIKDLMAEVAQAQEENRVKDECLEIAMEALKKYGNMHHSYARRRLAEIKRRLAQLKPEEETG